MKTKCATFLLALAFAASFTTPAQAGSVDPGTIAVDAIIGRPACLVATIVGSAVFLVALPVAATSGSVDAAADSLVVKPARATFVRPLGDFNYSEEYAAHSGKSQRVARATNSNRHAPKLRSPKS